MNKTLTKRQSGQTKKMIQVFALIARGSTIQQACAQVNIDQRTYRNWLVENPESVMVIQKAISAMERVNLASIATARSRVLERLITAIDTEGEMALSPRALLEIDGYLGAIQREIEEKHGAGVREDLKAKEFLLTGPTLQRATSRVPGTTVNIKPQSDGSVDVTLMKAVDIIDAESYDSGTVPEPQIYDQPSRSG
jgi:hypothetical protein